VIPFSGVIPGQTTNSTENFRFRLFPANVGGTFCFEETQVGVPVFTDGFDGYFSVFLGDGMVGGIPPSPCFTDNTSLWIAFAMDGTPDTEIGARSSIPSSGYAHFALGVTDNAVTTAKIQDMAVTSTKIEDSAITSAKIAVSSVDSSKIVDGSVGASQVDPTQVQRRVIGSCDVGNAIRVINDAGTVTCEPTGGGGGIGGSGTVNSISKFTAPTTIGNSTIFETGGRVGIGTTTPVAKLEAVGDSSTTSIGVQGSSPNNIGVVGRSTSGFGVFGASDGTGVVGGSNNGVGVEGGTGNPSKPGVFARSAGGGLPANLGLLVHGRAEILGRAQIFARADIGGDVTISGRTDIGGNLGLHGVLIVSNAITLPNIANADGRGLANAWVTYSSRRWKTNIQPIEEALAKVERLRGVSFDWKENGGHDIGLIAEEVGEVVPEVVAYEENGKDARSLDYARLTAVLIEAVKEQQRVIEGLKKKTSEIDELKAEVKGLKAKLSDGQLVSVSVSGVHDEP
jgi:hypothetical protein